LGDIYNHVKDLSTFIEIPQDGVLSRTLYADDRVKAVIFGFDTGQELSEHTASMPAIIQIVKGRARVTLAGDTHDAEQGFWVHMPANLSHSIYATTPVVMLLLMLKTPK
jgi:quercetin dioxygenase-like cupin family protein